MPRAAVEWLGKRGDPRQVDRAELAELAHLKQRTGPLALRSPGVVLARRVLVRHARVQDDQLRPAR